MILDQSDLEMSYRLELFWNQLKANLIGHVPLMIPHKMSGIIYYFCMSFRISRWSPQQDIIQQRKIEKLIKQKSYETIILRVKPNCASCNEYSLWIEPYTILVFHLNQKTHVFVTHILIGCSYIAGCIQLKPLLCDLGNLANAAKGED